MRADKKILLIEDNLIAQIAATKLLTRAGFNVDTACDGTDGISLYSYYHYDAVILDISLPDINGFEVAKRIRRYEQEHRKSPIQIVALTASVDEYPKQNYQQVGINEVFNKPLQDEMLDIICTDKNQ